MREPESAASLNVCFFLSVLFVSRLRRFLVTPSPTHGAAKNDDVRKLGNDVLRYGFRIDLEQEVGPPSLAIRWH